ncbi:hypothetical protein QUB70_27295 [Microcoleus sp. A003_D6]
MPIPQSNSFFVEQASCLFLKMVQYMSNSTFRHSLLTIIRSVTGIDITSLSCHLLRRHLPDGIK